MRNTIRPTCAAARPPGGQLVDLGGVLGIGDLERGFFLLDTTGRRQVGERTLDLLEGATDRDAEHALPALEQVDDLLGGPALVDGGPVGDEGHGGQVFFAPLSQRLDGLFKEWCTDREGPLA